MEEIDNIIIESLKHLECEIPEEVDNLKQFDADLVLNAVSTCLEAIKPGSKLPKKLPPSMSQKLKIATEIAQQIKDLGFRGDMGYQTILYYNEIEVRRVLMFLIERLPREASKSVLAEGNIGYVPKLVNKIEANLRKYANQCWISASLLRNGVREVDNGYLVHSLGNSCNLETVRLNVPDCRIDNEELKQYWVRILPDVTKQCPAKQLIPSLLFQDCEFSPECTILKQNVKLIDNFTIIDDTLTSIATNSNNQSAKANITQPSSPVEDNKLKTTELIAQVKLANEKYKHLQDDLKGHETKLEHLEQAVQSEQEQLKHSIANIKLKNKTLVIANKDENILKLRKMVDEASNHLIDLANQWNKVQGPLLDEYRLLQSTLSSDEIKLQENEAKLANLRNVHMNLIGDYKEKENLELALQEKVKLSNKNNNRSSYTKRILEIIANIKKQNNEIDKVLKDTKEIQREISYLTGQVERSFTTSDETIFYDAKEDDTARRSYKLLVALRDECGSIFQAIDDLGLTEREARNLEEQIESEKAKGIGVKLERVEVDLEEMKKEVLAFKQNV